jgi:hypothetical protein
MCGLAREPQGRPAESRPARLTPAYPGLTPDKHAVRCSKPETESSKVCDHRGSNLPIENAPASAGVQAFGQHVCFAEVGTDGIRLYHLPACRAAPMPAHLDMARLRHPVRYVRP